MSVPRALQPFLDLASVLRRHGFAVAPDQTSDFITAVGLLGPGDMTDIHRAGLALFSVPPERRAEYDALFRAVFLGQAVAAPVAGDDEDEVTAYDPTGAEQEIDAGNDESEVGGEAAIAERLSHRSFAEPDADVTLQQFRKAAPAALPRRRSQRRRPSRAGDAIDMARTLRRALKSDGELFDLAMRKRKSRQRRIVLLIDVSGSMEARSEPSIRFAHALAQTADSFEAFTLGTRLTRITRSLRARNEAQALADVGALVADFDGGTRLGDALQAFLSVPRFTGFARGAAVIVLSDGLERGDPGALIDAVARLSRQAWRIDWLSPIATGAEFAPRTEALAAIRPYLASLGDGSTLEAVCEHVLDLKSAA
ncbi:MAG: VWA domain-containing protein [Pseudomonadota bacterium]